MSFKTEAAKVRAGIASGGYQKKSNPFQGFVDELASGLKKQDEEKRQEERVKRQEARVAARSTKAKQDAEDKLEREREQLANFYFTSTGQAPNPQNKSAIMSVIKGGNFTDFSDLEDHMKQYSTYSEGTPQATIDEQMQNAGMLQPGDGPYQAVTEEASNLSPEGSIEFTGKKEVPDLEGITENNYLARLRTAELAGKAATVTEITNLAAKNGWDKKINGVSKTEMAGKTSAYFADFISQVDEQQNPEDFEYLNGRLTEAKMREADPAFWSDPVKLSAFDANTLQAFIDTGNYEKGSEAYKSINGYLLIRRVQEGDADINTLAGAGAQKIDQFIKANAARMNKDQLNTLTDMRSIAEEYEAAGQEMATAKQIAQEAYIAQGSINTLSGDARIEAMATFEKGWKLATDTSTKDPEFWQKPEELAKIAPTVLKTMLDAGLVGDPTSDAYQAVEKTYNAKSGLIAGDLSQLEGKSVVVFEQWATQNAELLAADTQKALTFARMKSLQVEKEKADAPDERLLTAKQIAFDAFVEANNTSELTGKELLEKMGQFEKDWDAASKAAVEKDATYTSSNYAADLIKFEGMLKSTDAAERKVAADWFNITKPIIEKTFTSIANIDINAKIAGLVAGGISQDRAVAIANGTIKLTTDAFGKPILVDTRTGDPFLIGGQPTDLAMQQSNIEERLTDEEKAIRAAAFEEMEVALADSGFAGQIDNLDKISAAFGPEGWAGKIVNKITGLFNSTGMPNTQEATKALAALNKVTKFNIISAFPGLRDSVSLKKDIENLFTDIGKFTSSKPDALEAFKNVKALLDQSIIQNEAIANSKDGIKVTKISDANVALISIRPLSELYGKVIENMEGSGKSEAVTGSVFKSNNSTTTPVITGKDDQNYDNIQVGEKYIYQGKTYIKGK